MWQLRVSRSRCNGSETCADGLLCAAAAPARAHERLRRMLSSTNARVWWSPSWWNMSSACQRVRTESSHWSSVPAGSAVHRRLCEAISSGVRRGGSSPSPSAGGVLEGAAGPVQGARPEPEPAPGRVGRVTLQRAARSSHHSSTCCTGHSEAVGVDVVCACEECRGSSEESSTGWRSEAYRRWKCCPMRSSTVTGVAGSHSLSKNNVKVGGAEFTSATATGPAVLADWIKISVSAGSDRVVKSRRLCVRLAAGARAALRATARRPWSSAGALGGRKSGGGSREQCLPSRSRAGCGLRTRCHTPPPGTACQAAPLFYCQERHGRRR